MEHVKKYDGWCGFAQASKLPHHLWHPMSQTTTWLPMGSHCTKLLATNGRKHISPITHSQLDRYPSSPSNLFCSVSMGVSAAIETSAKVLRPLYIHSLLQSASSLCNYHWLGWSSTRHIKTRVWNRLGDSSIKGGLRIRKRIVREGGNYHGFIRQRLVVPFVRTHMVAGKKKYSAIEWVRFRGRIKQTLLSFHS